MPFSFPSLKGLCFFMNPLVPISQLLSELSCIWLHDGAWSQTKHHINRKARLSTEHEVVGAEPCGWVSSAVVRMDQVPRDPSTPTSSPWVTSQAYWSEWNWTVHIDHWSADDMGWSVSSALPSTHRAQPPTDSQNFVPDRWVFFQEDHSGQWLVPQGLCHCLSCLGPGYICWAYLVKWSVITRTFSSQPFPGSRHRKSKWTSSKGWVATMFLREAFGCLALKARQGWHFPMCSFTWTAMWGQKNLSRMRSSMRSRPKWPTSSWHPLRATSL